MDDSDAEDFNKFIEKHWGKEALKATMLYDAEEGELEHKPVAVKKEKVGPKEATPKTEREETIVVSAQKRRGRPSKKV